MKPVIFRGEMIHFKKKYKHISKDYPASPYVVAYIKKVGGMEEVGRGFTKQEALVAAKRALSDPYQYGYGGPY